MERIITDNMSVQLEQVTLDGEKYFRISNSDAMRPFFMSIVSDSDHWMFISSNGGLTCGRKNSEFALFPYYTDDKITKSADDTGSKSIFLVHTATGVKKWEPFSEREGEIFQLTRNLYKNVYGNKVRFEEVNHDLNLTFSYEWNSSQAFGFVRKSKLTNHNVEEIKISLLDGIQNILPATVNSDLQMSASNLVDAYKRSELIKASGLGIYALSAVISDKAEPSEALKANAVWSIGLDKPSYLLSSSQVSNFRRGNSIQEELDIKAEKGAFLVHTNIMLEANHEKDWMIIAEVNQTHSKIVRLSNLIAQESITKKGIQEDINQGTTKLIKLVAAADGIQKTADDLRDARHYSNVLFNIMRGGIFDNNYQIEKQDFLAYLNNANTSLASDIKNGLQNLPDEFSIFQLKENIGNLNNPHLKRLGLEYLPLKFSRRHGDPSRPWNRFSIETQNEDGSKVLNYEGNWRDIFQNWEALAHSYPEFIESMILKFLNASTFDGYNPYRVTKDGFDWEIIEPDDPWSYIGYWGDHQVIYLLKFLEFVENLSPGKLGAYFKEDLFVYANVPYQIKSYSEILKDPKDTITFNHHLHEVIEERRAKMGVDGALLQTSNGKICQVNFIEKILAVVLSKFSNFIPEAGIWMNTQRPEWNDANNALVGNGVSLVTLNYLNRFLKFLSKILKNIDLEEVSVSKEVVQFFKEINASFEHNLGLLNFQIDDFHRKKMLDELGKAGSEFRLKIYNEGFKGEKSTLSIAELKSFVKLGLKFAEHTIKKNLRHDNLYHAYNLMTINQNDSVSISYLSEMLEGQVAVLSSGHVSPTEALSVLDALKASSLFRVDQYSYILYPNKNIPKFQDRNTITNELVKESTLLKRMIANNDFSIIEKDILGDFHFNASFKNAKHLKAALEGLNKETYGDLIEKETGFFLNLYEQIFEHKSFTGRSGTFFGYEGLGSIYWHMVSKLQLATLECCLAAAKEDNDPVVIGKLLEHYYEINEGIGCHKSPTLYGAFPTDPYSHTPAGKGAQQPGMTGQVKEDILSRFGELGLVVKEGKLGFNPQLLRKDEFLKGQETFNYIDLESNEKEISLDEGSLCFTYCQVPVKYILSKQNRLSIWKKNNEKITLDNWELDQAMSENIFKRNGEVIQIEVEIVESYLK